MRNPRPGSVWTPSRWARRGRYADYVQSKAWARRRKWWFREHRRRAGEEPVCLVCGDPEVDLHHLDYARLGGEQYGDLIALCRTHHNRIHAAWDATPHLRKLGRRASALALISKMRPLVIVPAKPIPVSGLEPDRQPPTVGPPEHLDPQ